MDQTETLTQLIARAIHYGSCLGRLADERQPETDRAYTLAELERSRAEMLRLIAEVRREMAA